MKTPLISPKNHILTLFIIILLSSPFYFFCENLLKSCSKKEINSEAPTLSQHEFNLISESLKSTFKNHSYLIEKLTRGATVLILYTDVPGLGCRECLGLEVCDWRDYSLTNKCDSVSVLCVVSKCKNEARLLQEIRAMKVNSLILFSNSIQVKEWTPYVFLLYDGKMISSYLGDMNDRDKTEKYMKEFKSFLSQNKLK